MLRLWHSLPHLKSLVLHSMTSHRYDNIYEYGEVEYEYDDNIGGAHKQPDVAHTRSLLQLLPQLSGLTRLDVLGLAGLAAANDAVPHWTCLRRCTSLQVLRLQHLRMHRDSWRHMFAGAQLGGLQELWLTSA